MQQQGDVLIRKVNCVPKGSKKLNHLVLAEGEVTGHLHEIKEKENAELYEKNGVMYLDVKEKCNLTHQEHNTQEISPGIYQIGIVQEYDYLEEMTRRVAD